MKSPFSDTSSTIERLPSPRGVDGVVDGAECANCGATSSFFDLFLLFFPFFGFFFGLPGLAAPALPGVADWVGLGVDSEEADEGVGEVLVLAVVLFADERVPGTEAPLAL